MLFGFSVKGSHLQPQRVAHVVCAKYVDGEAASRELLRSFEFQMTIY